MSEHIPNLMFMALEHEARANIDKAEAPIEIYFNGVKQVITIDGNEYEPNIIYNTYFSIGRFEPYTSPLGEPEWPNLNKWIWLRPNIISVVDTPIRLFQLTLKPVTNSGNILYEYGDTSIDE